jgi:hypothetical protein
VTGYKGGYGSGVEVIRGPDGSPLPGRPVKPTGQQPNATVIFVWDHQTHSWKLVTQFPSDEPVGVDR